MSVSTFTLQGFFTTIVCYRADCRMTFAVPTDVDNGYRKTRETFYCPRGHSQGYLGESEVERLKREVAQKQQHIDCIETDLRRAREQRDKAEHSTAIVKGQSKALKTRIKNGVCIHCNRSFENLRRHMVTKHAGHVEAAR